MPLFGSGSTSQFGDDGYDPRLPSQRFVSVSNYDADSSKDSSPIFSNQPHLARDGAFGPHPAPGAQWLPSIYSKGGPSSPSTAEVEQQEGFALREWRRRNAVELEDKERKEKEKLEKIVEEAAAYKAEFYQKRRLSLEMKKAANRESEKAFVENRERFHAEAEKNYWKAIAKLVPREAAAAVEKRGRKREKEKEKTASVAVIQGPKPGKPTDLSRLRQILVKLKSNPPAVAGGA